MTTTPTETLLVAVCGAHMRGMPLEPQMQKCGAEFDSEAQTDDSYRFYALTDKSPIRPGLIRGIPGSGAPIALELWTIAPAGLGQLMTMVDTPLGIGTLQLADRRKVKGFVCEAIAAEANAEDITGFGSWRAFLSARAGTATTTERTAP